MYACARCVLESTHNNQATVVGFVITSNQVIMQLLDSYASNGQVKRAH
jgi:hypothetical protein